MRKKTNFLLALALTSISAIKAQNADTPLWLRNTSISPDGKTILFTYKGDIYKVATEGGEAIPLTTFDGNDYNPIWSPDGSQIAFSSDRYGNYDIFIMPANGGLAKRLTYNSAGDIPRCFTPDGKNIIFNSSRLDNAKSVYFPSGGLPEVYSVSVAGGTEKQISSVPMENIQIDKSGNRWLYHDKKGYEDPLRKHHTSSIARDVWMYDKLKNTHTKLTDFAGEDRNPLWSNDEKEIYYLSEKSGSYNVWKFSVSNPSSPTQISNLSKHPVRHLSLSNNGILCYNFNGEVYTQVPGNEPKKVSIKISTDDQFAPLRNESGSGNVTEMDISPDGKEVAYVVRGEVFVSSLENGITKRITNSPEQERSISFSPDGKSILYASEKNSIWGIYRTTRTREDEKHFFASTVLKEEPLVVNSEENFQPQFNNDGTEIAYLENRTAVKIYNLKSKTTRTILEGNRNYSYTDGDQWFQWSPDGKYLLVQFLEKNSWIPQMGLAAADGKSSIQNLTQTGYGAGDGRWAMEGKVMIYSSSRHGMKNHASWGTESDVYGLFFSKDAYERFKFSKDELIIIKEREEKEKEKKKKQEEIKGNFEKKEEKVEVKIDFDGLLDRRERLTIHSSDLADMAMTKDGEKLFYICKFDKNYDIWVNKFHDDETKLFCRLNAKSAGGMVIDKEGKNIFLVADGKIQKVNIENGEKKEISIKPEYTVDGYAERAYLFEHAWRQTKKKFYRTDMQGCDWDFYKKEYARFLPHINNNYDFAELLSELLGELNASHTGGRYSKRYNNPDETASLGLIFDNTFEGKGLKIAEVIDKSPVLLEPGTKIKAGQIIEKIDGKNISNDSTYDILMNRKSGKNVLLGMFDPAANLRWEETVRAISPGELNNLLYERWVKKREEDVERLSKGRLGYVHVQGMNDESFRRVYERALGKHGNKEALIVDTRFNGGGWLHDDLATFLSGKKYLEFEPRNQKLSDEPQFKWIKPTVVLISEGNYSDAHMFPVVYKELKIGKLIGMPVPGTGTAVWWENMMDNTLVFGIPQVGVKTLSGEYLENLQLEPDIKVANDPSKANEGIDQQLETAVDELLKQLGTK